MKNLKVIFLVTIPLFCLYYFGTKNAILFGLVIASMIYVSLYLILDIEKLRFTKNIHHSLDILWLIGVVIIGIACIYGAFNPSFGPYDEPHYYHHYQDSN